VVSERVSQIFFYVGF